VDLASHDMLDEEEEFLLNLPKSNNFTEGELAENRLHRIARSQRGRLWCVALEPLRTSLSALLGWLIFLFVLRTLWSPVLFAFVEVALGKSLYVLFAIVTVGVIVSFIFKLLGSFGVALNLVIDILQGEAVCLEGRVSASSFTEKAKGLGQLHGEVIDDFVYAIGNDYLRVSEEAVLVLRPYSGSVFRVYATPRSRLLLSIEPVKLRRADRLVK
jgi:hypothetical protein